MKKIILVFISVTIVTFASAQSGSGTLIDPYYGSISASVTWDLNSFPGGVVYIGKAGTPASTYNDITVNSGGHLTIGPGITVTFLVTTSDLVITGSGVLTANGTASSQIIFTKGSSISHWGHITFETPGTATPITGTGSFEYCKVEYGYSNGAFPNPNSAGGAIQISAPNVTINNCYFNNNYATFGGGVTVNTGQNTVIQNCYFKNNSANECAGAILLYLNSAATIRNCIFESNSCAGATQVYYGGGAIWTRQNTSIIVNCTFINNTSPRAGDALYSYSSPTSKIINSIFWGSNDQYATTGAASAISYSAFETIKPATSINSIILNSNNSDPAGPNFAATDGSDWSIKYISPCRDAGTTPSPGVPMDYLGNPRIGPYDIGAYEVQYSKWTGASSTDWATASNWVANVDPSTGSGDVVIPTALTNYPTSSTTQDFTIGAGKQMIIEQGARATLNNLTNNGTLKLNSTAAGFASLIINSYTKGGGSTEEIQMFLTGGGTATPLTYKWHYISSPVASLAVSTFSPSVTLDLAQWIESYPVLTLSQGWVAFDGYIYSTGGSGGPTFTTLDPGKGYDYYKNANYTFTFGGQLNTSDVSVSLNYTSGNNNLHGYNLLGNPFCSGLDWDYIVTHSFPANTSKSIYFTKNSTLCSYINGVGVPSDVNGIIPPMQGFFNKTSSAGNSIIFAAAARTNANIHSIYKGSAVIPLVRLSLTDDTFSDETVVRFDDLAKSDFDYDFDATKMFLSPDLTSIYSSLGGTDYAINGLPFPVTSVEIPIVVNLTASGNHTITSTQLQGLDNYDVTLTDITTGFVADLKTNPVLTFSAGPGSIGDRFVLKVGTITTGVKDPVISNGTFNIYPANNMLNIQTISDIWDGKSGSVKVFDMTGKTISNVDNSEFSKNSLTQVAAPDTKGIYFVEIRSGAMRYVGKVVIR